MIRVVIASDYPMVRAGLQALLADDEDIAVVGQSAVGEPMLGMAAQLHPDVVLLDISADPDLAPLSRLAQEAPGLGIVVLSSAPDGDFVARAIAAGARGYLFKEAPGDDLVATVRAVHQGLVIMHPAAANAALSRAGTAAQPPANETLTARELEVLALLAQGLPNKIIAARLRLSEHTVKFHVASIMGKLGAASRTEAVTLAARQGLIAL